MRRLSQEFSNAEADSSGSDNDTDTESRSSCSKSIVSIQSQDLDPQTSESLHVIDQVMEVAVVESLPVDPLSVVDVDEALVNFQLEAIGLGADFSDEMIADFSDELMVP